MSQRYATSTTLPKKVSIENLTIAEHNPLTINQLQISKRTTFLTFVFN